MNCRPGGKKSLDSAADVGGGLANSDDGARGLKQLLDRNQDDDQDRDRHHQLGERKTDSAHVAAATGAPEEPASGTAAFWQDAG